MVPSGSRMSLRNSSTQESYGTKPAKQEYAIKREPDETEWVGVDTFCEATIEVEPSAEEAQVSDDEDTEIDTKEDRDWTLNDADGDDDDEEDAEDGKEAEEGEEGEVVYSAMDLDETGNSEDVKPKRKYTPKNKEAAPKKPKTEKADAKPREKQEGPSLDEMVLQHHKLVCDLCEEPLEDFVHLRKHFKYVHNQLGYMKCCDKKFTKKCWMVEHIQLHLNPDAFHCGICNKSYSSSQVLKEHTKEVHSPDEIRHFKCKVCQKLCVSNRQLNAHIMMAHGSVPCPHCPKTLASQGSLKKHLLAMHGEGEQYVCDVCARVFRSKQCFDTHVKGHLGTRQEDKMQCTVCSVWFADKNCLTRHIRRMHIPSDEMLACELCGKQVRNRDALNCHMNRTHTESRFECELCNKKFKRPHHMREHIAIHHTGEDLYGCTYCMERFNSKNKLYMHRKTVHPVEFEEEMRKRVTKDP